MVEDTPLTTDHATSQPVEAAEPAPPLLRVSLLFAGHLMAYLVCVLWCLPLKYMHCIMQG